jgi:carbonic anhydrase/acetyltransferase-like protein (isoleucine patch superfamily)
MYGYRIKDCTLMILDYEGKHPRIGDGVFLAPTSIITGDVEIGERSSIWFGAVIRGDRTLIRIGRNTNIQDNCTIHSDPSFPVSIGDFVSLGHNAVIHGGTIEDDCIIGIGAVILNGAIVRKGSIVASGAVVREGQIVGPSRLAAGIPACEKKELGHQDILNNRENARIYMELAAKYLVIKR